MNSLILWALLLEHRRRRRYSEDSNSSDDSASSSDEYKTSNVHKPEVSAVECIQQNSLGGKTKKMVNQSTPTQKKAPQTPAECPNRSQLIPGGSPTKNPMTVINSANISSVAVKRCNATNSSSEDQHTKRIKTVPAATVTDCELQINIETDDSNEQLSIISSNNPCTVIIAHKTNPKLKLSNEEFLKIKGKLLDEIDESEDFGTNLGFLSIVLENGWIKLTCQNDGTRDWVLKIINKINISLKMDLMASISMALPKTFICIIKLSSEDIMSPDALKRRLAKQNKDLSTGEWTLLHTVKLEEGGESLIYCIDEKSKEQIEAAQKKLFLNFSQIIVEIADET